MDLYREWANSCRGMEGIEMIDKTIDDSISRRAMLDVLPRFHFRSMNDYLEAEYYIENLPSTQTEPIKINIEDFNKEDWERFKKEWENTPITVLPAQTKLKKGRWIDDGKGLYMCSSCGKLWVHWWARVVPLNQMCKELRYCPSCGADMRGEQDD